MKKTRDILLCDLDAFFASVEQLDNPSLKGLPVIVGGSPEGRGVVSTCSYEARKYGVRSAMPMKKAVALCPGAIVLSGRMHRYKELSLKVRNIFERYTPDIEVVSIDEAYLAVKSGEGFQIGKIIHAAVKADIGLPISVGVSSSKLLAKIACEQAKPDAVGILPLENVRTILWPLPLKVLPGIGPVTEKKLKSAGMQTVKDIAQCPPGSLTRLLGNSALNIHNYANGIDNRELELANEAKSISEETTFPEDIYDLETMLMVLLEQSAGVGFRIRSAGITARTVTIKLRTSTFKTITRGKTLPETVSEDSEIYKTAKDLFLNQGGKPPWRLVGVQLSGFEIGKQETLLQNTPQIEKSKALTRTKDSLRKKYGSEVIIQGKRLAMKNKDV